MTSLTVDMLTPSLARTLVRLGRKKDATAQLEAFLAEARKDDRLRLMTGSGSGLYQGRQGRLCRLTLMRRR